MEVVGASSTGRNTRYMMEGVGGRVIRGPDWKWGKQVSLFRILESGLQSHFSSFSFIYFRSYLIHLSLLFDSFSFLCYY